MCGRLDISSIYPKVAYIISCMIIYSNSLVHIILFRIPQLVEVAIRDWENSAVIERELETVDDLGFFIAGYDVAVGRRRILRGAC